MDDTLGSDAYDALIRILDEYGDHIGVEISSSHQSGEYQSDPTFDDVMTQLSGSEAAEYLANENLLHPKVFQEGENIYTSIKRDGDTIKIQNGRIVDGERFDPTRTTDLYVQPADPYGELFFENTDHLYDEIMEQ